MKEKNIDLKVGIFVFLGIMTIVISIFAISGDQSLFSTPYRLTTKFKQVTGLVPGSVVQVLGFPVGNVEEIGFDRESKKLIVTMKIYKKFQDKINEDAIADLRTKGALGDKYIYITPGISERILQDGEEVGANAEEDFISRITSKGAEIDRVFSILKKIDLILTDINGERQVKEIMMGLKGTANELKLISSDIRAMTKSLKDSETGVELGATVKKLSSVLDKIDRGEGTLGALINDPSVHDSLKRVLGAKSYNQTLKTVIRSSIQESEDSN